MNFNANLRLLSWLFSSFFAKFRYFLSKKVMTIGWFWHIFWKILQSILPYSHGHFSEKNYQNNKHIIVFKWFFRHIFLYLCENLSWEWCDFSIFLKNNSYVNYTVLISFLCGKIRIFIGKNTLGTWLFSAYFWKLSHKTSW